MSQYLHKSPFFAPLGICSGDASFRKTYCAALERLGKVREFSHLPDRVENLQLVVVDLDSLEGEWESCAERARQTFGEGELIAVSKKDTSGAALHCLRSGFADYLLKPVAPEQLHWAVQRALQRIDIVGRLKMEPSRVNKAVSRISTAGAAPLVRQALLEYARATMTCTNAAWITPQQGQWNVERALPEPPLESTLDLFPVEAAEGDTKPVVRSDGPSKAMLLPCHNRDKGGVVFSGLKAIPTTARLSALTLLLEYAEATLLNLENYEDIKRQTFVDDLTGLYNARYLKFLLPRYVELGAEAKFSVLFIDVDRFKSINDTHGHLVGSDFLIAIARTIKFAVRGNDPVFRYGGDEFVVVLEGMNDKAATEVAERIRKHVERRIFVIRQKRLKTTVSIGVASCPPHKATSLLQLADDAMYAVKRKSRNSVSLAPVESPRPPEVTP